MGNGGEGEGERRGCTFMIIFETRRSGLKTISFVSSSSSGE